jgi:AcrR family transcriptional regulator
MRKKPAEPTTTRKKRGFGQERRREILVAATELFTAEGYNRVTTRAIARKVGISQTGLYVYFKTKEDILRAIRNQMHEALTLQFYAAVAAGRTPKDALRKLVRSYIDFGLSHPAEYQLTFTISAEALAPIEKDFSQPYDTQDPGGRSFLQFRDHLARLSQQGLKISFDPMTAVQILWFAGHGAVSLLISHSHFPWTDRKKLIDSLERFVMAGLSR